MAPIEFHQFPFFALLNVVTEFEALGVGVRISQWRIFPFSTLKDQDQNTNKFGFCPKKSGTGTGWSAVVLLFRPLAVPLLFLSHTKNYLNHWARSLTLSRLSIRHISRSSSMLEPEWNISIFSAFNRRKVLESESQFSIKTMWRTHIVVPIVSEHWGFVVSPYLLM